MKGQKMTTAVLHGGPLDGLEVELGEITKGIVLGAAVHYDESGFPFLAAVCPSEPACEVVRYGLFQLASESALAFYVYEGKQA